MKKQLFSILASVSVVLSAGLCPLPASAQPRTLKDAFAGKFVVGTAMSAPQIEGRDTAAVRVIKSQFNAIVAENCMKSGPIQPREGEFDFSLSDKFVEFGVQNKMHITGHTLVWHSQTPSWFFRDAEGKDVSREVLIERMKKHIYTVVGRYKGKIKGWDVINEVIDDRDGSLRRSKFLQIIGEDYIKLAFQFAHEADPAAELYYNDYSLFNPAKRKGAVAMVKKLIEQGVKIDAVGEQCHVGLDFPTIEEYEQTINDFAALGVKVMITEMEISVLPSNRNTGADVSGSTSGVDPSNPYVNGLPDSINKVFEQRYVDFFKLFLKHSDKITRVTLWGVDDGQSWKNGWPIPGRTDYPLLIDRKFQPKPVVQKIIEEAIKQQ